MSGGAARGAHMSGLGGQYVIIDRDPASGLVVVVLNNPDPVHHPTEHPHANDYLTAVRSALLA